MAATAAANAPMWLTRESEVLEHLFHATAEIGEVWVEYGGQTHGATLSWPDRNARIFGLFLDPSAKGVLVPPPGSVVRVRYASQGAVYAFLTSVERAEAQGSWVLHFPRSVQRSERRAVERRAVHGMEGFRFEVQGEVVMSFPLYDISPLGVGYVASRTDAQVRPGTKVSGWLCLPDQTRLAVEMELRHIRSLPGSRTAVIVGCRFLTGDAALTQEIEAAVAGIPPIWD
jgi:hypothetical protein